MSPCHTREKIQIGGSESYVLIMKVADSHIIISSTCAIIEKQKKFKISNILEADNQLMRSNCTQWPKHSKLCMQSQLGENLLSRF